MKRLSLCYSMGLLCLNVMFLGCAKVDIPESQLGECLGESCLVEGLGDSESQGLPGTDTTSESNDTGFEQINDTGPEIDTDEDTGPEIDTDTDTGPEIDTDTDTGPEIDTDTDTGTGLADPICELFDDWTAIQNTWLFWTAADTSDGWQNYLDNVYHNGAEGTIDDWLVSPQYDLSLMSSSSLVLSYRSKAATDEPAAEIYASNTTTLFTAFYKVATIYGTLDENVETTIDLNSYAGSSGVYLAFVYGRLNSTDQFLIDEFCIEDQP